MLPDLRWMSRGSRASKRREGEGERCGVCVLAGAAAHDGYGLRGPTGIDAVRPPLPTKIAASGTPVAEVQ